MMIRVKRESPIFEATQFTGGAGSAKEIISILNKLGWAAAYRKPVPPFVHSENTRFSHGGFPEGISAENAVGTFFLDVNWWILVNTEDKSVMYVTDERFKDDFDLLP